MDENILHLSKEKISQEAIRRHPHFWQERADLLEKVFLEVSEEMIRFNEAGETSLVFSPKEAASYKAVWCISGSGSYNKPLLDTPSDNVFKDRLWYHGSDKARLDHSAEVISRIAEVISGETLQSDGAKTEIIEKYGPVLIYNGVLEQDEVLMQNAGNRYIVPKSHIFIPEGAVERTIDQVKTFALPSSITLKKSDRIGIVSNATHLSRVMRMIGKYPRPFKNANIVLFPIEMVDKAGEAESRKLEMLGILDYIAKDEATVEPCSYTLMR